MEQTTRRVIARSARGDIIWQLCQPVLSWLIENADETLQAQAIETRAYWEHNQRWLLELLVKQHFFDLADRAMQDMSNFKRALATIPPATTLENMLVDYWIDNQHEPVKVDVFAYLALEAALYVKRQQRMKGNVLLKYKRMNRAKKR